MSTCQIIYYIAPNGKNVIKEFITKLQLNQKIKVLRMIQLIDQYGLTTANPHLKKITSTPLWEIRILGKDNIRILYLINTPNSILLLHGFTKKTQKTPPKEIQTALKRLSEWQSRN